MTSAHVGEWFTTTLIKIFAVNVRQYVAGTGNLR